MFASTSNKSVSENDSKSENEQDPCFDQQNLANASRASESDSKSDNEQDSCFDHQHLDNASRASDSTNEEDSCFDQQNLNNASRASESDSKSENEQDSTLEPQNFINITHCRFCAESMEKNDLLNFGEDMDVHAELQNILNFLNINYIDLSIKGMPRTVCEGCYDCLHEAYSFFSTAKESQSTLFSLYQISTKCEPNDEVTVKQEVFSDDTEELESAEFSVSIVEVTVDKIPLEETVEINNDKSNENIKNCSLKSKLGKKLRNACKTETQDTLPQPDKSSSELLYSGIKVLKKEVPIEKFLKSEALDANCTKSDNNQFNVEMVKKINDDKAQYPETNRDASSKPFLEILSSNSDLKALISRKRGADDSWTSYSWRCLHCTMWCDSMVQLREHSKQLHNKCYGFSCADCRDTFNTFNSFVEHVRWHRDALRFYCAHCNKKFQTVEQCAQHTFSHWSGNQKICSFCGEVCPDPESLVRHNRMYKRSRLPLRDYRKKPRLVRTLIKAADMPSGQMFPTWKDYAWTCSECYLKVPDVCTLRRHARDFHGKCFTMKCMDCLKSITNYRMFVQHATGHRPYLSKSCQYCDRYISDADEMTKHISDHMTGDHQPCDGCGETFQNKQLLDEHIKQYDPPRRKGACTTKDLTCDICNKTFDVMCLLKKHKAMHGKRERNHVCDTCGKGFYSKGTLTGHAKSHITDKNEICKICGRAFKSLTKLKCHLKTHDENNQFTCDVCGRSFKLKHRLKCHIETHMDFKKYKCTVCGKEFKHGGNLKNHMHQHTGQRPYCCQYCEKAFTNWANCNKHMIRKHGVSLAKTKRTPQGSYNLDSETGAVQAFATDEKTMEWMREMMKPLRPRKNKLL